MLVSVPDGGASGRQAAPVHLPGRPEGLLRHRRERRQDRHWQEVLLHPGLTPLRPGLAEMSRAGGAGEGSLSSPRACRRRLRGLEIRSREEAALPGDKVQQLPANCHVRCQMRSI